MIASGKTMADEKQQRINQLEKELDTLNRNLRKRKAVQEEELRRLQTDNQRLKSQLERNSKMLDDARDQSPGQEKDDAVADALNVRLKKKSDTFLRRLSNLSR